MARAGRKEFPMPKRWSLPFLFMTVTEGDEGSSSSEGDGQQEQGGVEDQQQERGLGFPENTPVAEMSADEKAAYWREQSKKQERIARDVQSELKSVKDALEAQRQAQLSEDERKIEDAKNAARAEGESEATARFLSQIVTHELRHRGLSAETATATVEVLDLSKLTNEDGSLNTDRLDALAATSGSRGGGGSAAQLSGAPTGKKPASVGALSVSERAEQMKNDLKVG